LSIFIEKPPEKLIDEDGTRIDGRKPDEMRPVRIEVGILENADGSAYIEWGGNRILAAVYGPRELHPKHLAQPDKAVLRCRYNMAPFSTSTRKKPGPDRRSIELSKVIREALEPSLFLHEFPGTTIDVFVEVLRSDAGTRVAGTTAASVALADAGIPMRGLVSACTVGRVGDVLVLDVGHEEDQWGDADLALSMLVDYNEITLLQMDGTLTPQQLKQAIGMAMDACKKIHELQKQAIREKYLKIVREIAGETST